jgi:hypothetical protein
METVLIRYRVKRDHLEQNLQLLHAVYEELDKAQPSGLRWVTYQLEDEVSFIDIVGGDGDPSDLAHLPAFQHFRSTLDGRCDEPPTMTEVREIGSFHPQ